MFCVFRGTERVLAGFLTSEAEPGVRVCLYVAACSYRVVAMDQKLA